MNPDYCTIPSATCDGCSLSSYRRDCHNNPIWLTQQEVKVVLGVSQSRVSKLAKAGMIQTIEDLPLYDRGSVFTYKALRGDKKGGRYPKDAR